MSAARAAGAKLAVAMERAATVRAFFKVIVIFNPQLGLAQRDKRTIRGEYDALVTGETMQELI
jgi:hypothetical protein